MVPFELKKTRLPEVREAEFGYVTYLNQFIHLHLSEKEKYDYKEIVKKSKGINQIND